MIQRFATFTFDSDQRLLLDANQRVIHVTPKAFDLLAVLIAAAPRVVTKVELHKRVWPGTFVTDTTLVGVVKELRRALGDRDSDAPLIRTSHGVGYAFTGVSFASPVVDNDATSHWLIIEGDRRVPLHVGENIIGRDPGSALWLDRQGVSRRHARIVVAGAVAQLEDLGSKNGTVLRGAPLSGVSMLNDGDQILIGPVPLQYRVSDSGAATATVTLLS